MSGCYCSGECKKIGYCPNQSHVHITQRSIELNTEYELKLENTALKLRIKKLEEKQTESNKDD